MITANTHLLDAYIAAFDVRCELARQPSQTAVSEPGVRGLLAGAGTFARLLVTDDGAHRLVGELLADAHPGIVNVLGCAPRCTELLRRSAGWNESLVTPMVCPDLAAVPAASLPSELTLRPVRRLAADDPGGVPLEDAVALAVRADPGIDESPDELATFLRSLSPSCRLFAAVDDGDAVRATSGSNAYGTRASALFVNTDPEWRNRGIGQAMTAAALISARERGATEAFLDSSDSGRSIYERLGFQAAAEMTHFFAPD